MHWDMLGVLSAVAIESIWTPRHTGVHAVELHSVANLVEMGENCLSQTDCDSSRTTRHILAIVNILSWE